MRISTMILAVMSILVMGGVGKRTLQGIGVNSRTALFFMLCIFALSGFEIIFSDEISASPACIAAAAWMYGYAHSSKAVCRKRMLMLPVSVVIGITGAALMPESNEDWVSYAIGAAAIPITEVFGSGFGMAAAALAPVFAAFFSFVLDGIGQSISSLEMGEMTLAAQLSGILFGISSEMVFYRFEKDFTNEKKVKLNTMD